MDEKFKNRSPGPFNKKGFDLSVQYHTAEAPHEERIALSVRTYATWLVRATRRKMAASGPENTPKKEVELT